MLKRILLVPMIAMFASFTSVAFAADNTIGFQFRVPFQATADKNVGSVNGQSTIVSFFLDQDTEVGVLNEVINLKDKSAGGTAAGYDVTAIRISKNMASGAAPVYVGMDIGSINVTTAAGASLGASTMADIFGGVRLLMSKGKVSSFLGAEIGYRIAKPALAGTLIESVGGTMMNLSVGLNF